MQFDVKEWCQSHIEGARLNGSNQYVGRCPWCGKDGRFYVDAEEGHYICFKCQERGRWLVGLIARVEGITRNEARQYILRRAVQFRRQGTPQTLLQRLLAMRGGEQPEVQQNTELPSEFIPVFRAGKWKMPVYLRERGVTRETAREWGLGWARTGRFACRLIIPVECPNGRSFTARDMTGQQEPKYLNPAGANHGRLLLGWKHAPLDGDVALVEGPLDAIKLWQHGIPALALMGKVLHKEQLEMLLAKPVDAGITVMLDPEEQTAPYDVARQLTCRFGSVHIARLPDGVDPGSATRNQARMAVESAERYTGGRSARLAASLASAQRKLADRYQQDRALRA